MRLLARVLALLAVVLATLLAPLGLAHAGTLARADVAALFPPPLVVGERSADLPAWPVFRRDGGALVLQAHVFETIDLEPVAGYGGRPVNLLVVLDHEGRFQQVRLLSHSEPLFTSVQGTAALTGFARQYEGITLDHQVLLLSPQAERRISDTTAALHGVLTGTVSALAIDKAVLESAARVARARAGVGAGSTAAAGPDALLKDLDRPAAAVAAAAPKVAPAAAGAGAGAGASASAGATPTVRVPYVPEFVRKEIKDELRAELKADGMREGWAGSGAVPGWVRGLKVEGDLRFRLQHDAYGDDNAEAINVQETNRTRALTLLNTTQDRARMRVRARLGVNATVDEHWSAGLRLTTGSTTDPLSSNQTLGSYGNRYTAAFDRAYVRFAAGDELSAVFGRFGNPWFGTDLLWASDLSFDGMALQWSPRLWGLTRGFLTVAAMPVQEVELSSHDKWLFGAQAGLDLPGNGVLRGKVGLGYYAYRNITGVPNAAQSSLNDFTAPAFAQKGNTYFNISTDTNRPLLALASDYRIVNLTGTLLVETIGQKLLTVTGDWAKNVGFDRAEVSARVGTDVEPQTQAWALRAAFGHHEVAQLHDWQVFFGYKHVERDAVLDAFADSDLRLGGTDVKGYLVGGSYGLGRHSVLGLRWLSGEAITGAPLAIDTLQVDLSLRF